MAKNTTGKSNPKLPLNVSRKAKRLGYDLQKAKPKVEVIRKK